MVQFLCLQTKSTRVGYVFLQEVCSNFCRQAAQEQTAKNETRLEILLK